MSQPSPFAELLDALRADGFPIGIDDYIRVARLLSREHGWSEPELRRALRVTLAKDLEARERFDEVWARVMGALPQAPASERVELRAVEPDVAEDVTETSPRSRRKWPWIAVCAAVAVLAASAVIVVLRPKTPTGPGPREATVAVTQDERLQAVGLKSCSDMEAPAVYSEDGGAIGETPLSASQPTPDDTTNEQPDPGAIRPPVEPDSNLKWIGSFLASVTRSSALLDLALLCMLVGFLLVWSGHRRRRVFLPRPWSLKLRIPRQQCVRTYQLGEIEDIAADLTWQSNERPQGIAIEASVRETAKNGGYPVLVAAPAPSAPAYVLLIEDGPSARPWRWLYEDLASDLRAAGLNLETYSYEGDATRLTSSGGGLTALRKITEKIDGVIVVGDVAGVRDPETGQNSVWLDELRAVPYRLWVSPQPRGRWDDAAFDLMRVMPIETGRSAFSLARPGDRGVASEKVAAWAPVVETHPGSLVATEFLRHHLGRAFPWLVACAVAGDPDLTVARWLGGRLRFEVSSDERLRLFALPWFTRHRWPGGIRNRLLDIARAEDPDLERRVHSELAELLRVNEPSPGSLAHLQWQIECADRRAHIGDRRAQAELAALVDSPLTAAATTRLRSHGFSSRSHRSSVAAVLLAIALAAGLIAFVGSRRNSEPDELWDPAGSVRFTEGRSSYWRASGYHPEAGGGNAVAPLPYVRMALLSQEGLAAAYLMRGEPALADNALKALEPLDASADVLSERALAHLVRSDAQQGDYEEALRLADAALEKAPGHGPALWNKAVALQGLNLKMLAARTFDAVADLGEPGWSGEAQAKAEQLRKAVLPRREQWYSSIRAGGALLASGALPPATLIDAPLLRLYFYDAVRTRTSAAQVKSLLPLARELDSRAGGTVLEDYVKAVARRDFAVRAPLAQRYLRLVTQGDAANDSALIADLLRSTEEDILIGTLVQLEARRGGTPEMPAFPRRVMTAADPWFDVLALQREAKAAQARGDLSGARQKIEEALERARQPGLELRRLDAELTLTSVLLRSSELEEAYKHAIEAWHVAQQFNEWNKEIQFIEELAQIALLRADLTLAQAYSEEAIERTRQDRNTALEHFARERIALADISWLRLDDARRQIDAAIVTGLPLSTLGALALADIARLRPRNGDATAMDAFRTQIPKMNPGERALAMHALGRFMIELCPNEGRKLLDDAIRQVKALPSVGDDASHALTYSYTSLILEAGKRGDFTSAWVRFEEEAGTALPARCMVGAAVDSERTLIVIRSASGIVDGAYDASRTSPIAERVDGLVPTRLVARLRDCAEVQVLARAPLYGRPEFLPRDIAWSYLLVRAGAAHDSAAEGAAGSHLIVQSVAYSAKRHLMQLHSWEDGSPDGNDLILSGAAATPTVVLQQMENASTIDIVTAGLVDPVSDEAYLVLAPDRDGDTLRASQIEKAILRHRPLVVLAACYAAHPGPQLAAPQSLPAAFLRAGARSVLAAGSEIPEKEGREFFNAVRERIKTGSTAARALRDVRESWIAQDRGRSWLDSVLLFE